MPYVPWYVSTMHFGSMHVIVVVATDFIGDEFWQRLREGGSEATTERLLYEVH